MKETAFKDKRAKALKTLDRVEIPEEALKEARTHVKRAKIDLALNRLEERLVTKNQNIWKEIFQLQARYHELKRRERAGIISTLEAQLESNKLSYSTIELILSLERSNTIK